MIGEIQNYTRISANNHFDEIIAQMKPLIFDGDDTTNYINESFREGAINWAMAKIDKYDPKRSSHDRYIQVTIRNYMISKHWKIRKDDKWRELVLKPYYREKKLNSIML
jgi:hypothetical protein